MGLGPPEAYFPLWREPGLSSMIHAPARKYLSGRGIGASTAKRAGIGACATGKLAGRIVVPVLDREGKDWLGWSARIWNNLNEKKTPKYLTAPGMSRHNIVYNMGALFMRSGDPCLVVEGVFDAIPYLPDVVALLGKPSEGQIQLLRVAERPLVVALDGDSWLEGEMLALRLQLEGKPTGWVRLPPREDPGSVDREWLKTKARRKAKEKELV